MSIKIDFSGAEISGKNNILTGAIIVDGDKQKACENAIEDAKWEDLEKKLTTILANEKLNNEEIRVLKDTLDCIKNKDENKLKKLMNVSTNFATGLVVNEVFEGIKNLLL